jgi:hypothetical protein
VSAGFKLGFVHEDRGELRMPLVDAVTMAFEARCAGTDVPASEGQRNFPGFYYAACLDAHVGDRGGSVQPLALAMIFDQERPALRVAVTGPAAVGPAVANEFTT